MSTQMTPVILVVDEHWLLGKMETGGQRVLDILSHTATDYLTLHEVKVFRSANCAQCVGRLPEAVVPKRRLGMLVIPTDKFEGRQTSRIHARVEKKKLGAYLVVAGYAVEGNLHVNKRIEDPLYTLTNTLSHFFPITEASVSAPGVEPIAAKVVIANKAFVSCFFSGDLSKTSRGGPSAPASHNGDAQRVAEPV